MRAGVAVGTCVSSHAPRPDPYVRLSRIRLVWGFLCQAASTPFFVVLCHSILLFDPRREHSFVPTACHHRHRERECLGRRFFSAAQGLSLTLASTAAGCPLSGSCDTM